MDNLQWSDLLDEVKRIQSELQRIYDKELFLTVQVSPREVIFRVNLSMVEYKSYSMRAVEIARLDNSVADFVIAKLGPKD